MIGYLQRIGTLLQGLLPFQRGLVFDDADFLVENLPEAAITGSTGSEGAITGYTRVRRSSAASLGAVSGTTAEGTASSTAGCWYNYTGASRVLTDMILVPLDDITQSDTNYWSIGFVLASAPSVWLVVITTQTSPTGEALVAGQQVAPAGSITVPAGETLLLKQEKTGSPTTLSLFGQAR